jgi:hypothetical protein
VHPVSVRHPDGETDAVTTQRVEDGIPPDDPDLAGALGISDPGPKALLGLDHPV